MQKEWGGGGKCEMWWSEERMRERRRVEQVERHEQRRRCDIMRRGEEIEWRVLV